MAEIRKSGSCEDVFVRSGDGRQGNTCFTSSMLNLICQMSIK